MKAELGPMDCEILEGKSGYRREKGGQAVRAGELGLWLLCFPGASGPPRLRK